LNHLGFELETEAEMLADYRAALDAGLTFHATVDHLVARSIYSWDPDGFGVEIYVDTEISYKQPNFLSLRRASGDWAPGKTPPSTERRYVADHKPVRYSDALFHATKVTGVVIVTDRFEAEWDYYTSLVGLRPHFGGRHDAVSSLGGSCGGRDITLVRAGDGLDPGFHHLHFAVFDEGDLDGSLARAGDFGITIERRIDDPMRKGAFVRDPDGIGVLFYADRRPYALDGRAPRDVVWLA
jgi:catechol 2,3-dioxygenase